MSLPPAQIHFSSFLMISSVTTSGPARASTTKIRQLPLGQLQIAGPYPILEGQSLELELVHDASVIPPLQQFPRISVQEQGHIGTQAPGGEIVEFPQLVQVHIPKDALIDQGGIAEPVAKRTTFPLPKLDGSLGSRGRPWLPAAAGFPFPETAAGRVQDQFLDAFRRFHPSRFPAISTSRP